MFDKSRKRSKPDFEAAAVVVVGAQTCLLVFGSGSTPARERIALVKQTGLARIVEAPAFYARLRDEQRFSGGSINIEGALVDGESLVLFSRGNGVGANGSARVDASVEVDALALLAHLEELSTSNPPELGRMEQYDLGLINGVRLSFTDAALRDGSRYYVAAAEASEDAIEDGLVSGVSFGVLTEHARYTMVVAEDGAPLRDKVEGITPGENASEWLAVVDVDDPSRAADLLRLRVSF